jgi:hypothetical protein
MRGPLVTIRRKRFITVLAILLSPQLIAVLLFLIARAPLQPDHWRFLELQRPTVKTTDHGSEATFFMVHDGLNFALARRAIGGWEEPASVKLFRAINAPALIASLITFNVLQMRPGGTSRSHSDIATVIFVVVAMTQWTIVSLLLSIRRTARR